MSGGSVEQVVVVALAAATVALLVFLTVSRSRPPAGDRGAHRTHTVPLRRQALAPLPAVGLATIGVAACLEPTAWAVPSVYAAGALVWAATLPWLALARRWSAAAHASWSLGATAALAYTGAMAWWTIGSGLGPLALAGAWLLWLLELAAVVLFLCYGYEIHDTLGSLRWGRRIGHLAQLPTVAGAPAAYRLGEGTDVAAGEVAAYQRPVAVATRADLPFVSIHVPSHNEPPELLLATLRSLVALDYPAFEVLVLDNNTTDDTLCEPVRRFCAQHPQRLRFHRLLDWPGYKSGALNYGLTQCDPRTELIAVVDADYQVQPDWLQAVAPVFADPGVGFVQTPQHYRQWEHAQYLRSLYYSYDYFFAVSQPSRDERDAAIFGGTMGVIRRSALEGVGGWDEWCITEEAELSLRLLAAGWHGHHLDKPFGAGIMPLTFEALKRQRFRWCFGGMQILRLHWRLLLPWRRGGRLRLGQRLGYLAGGVQWLGDLLGLVFALVLIASLLDLALGGGHIVRRLGGLLLVTVPGLGALGVVRALAGMRAALAGARWRDAVGAFAIWLSLGWVVALGSVRGLVEREGVFLRTPKLRGDVTWVDGIRANLVEVMLAALGLAAAGAALVLAPGWVSALLVALLALPVVGWLSAPAHSLAALRVELPAELSDRRDREDRLAWWGPRATWSLASVLGAAVVAGVVYAVVAPTSAELPQRARLPGQAAVLPSTGLGGPSVGASPAPGSGSPGPGSRSPAPEPRRSTAGSTPAGPSPAETGGVPPAVTSGAPVATTSDTPGPSTLPTPGPPRPTQPGTTRTGGQGRPTAPPGSPTTRVSPTRPTHTPPGRL